MAVWIKTLRVEVAGKVVRTYDTLSDTTTLEFDEDQTRVMHEELSSVVAFLDAQADAKLV